MKNEKQYKVILEVEKVEDGICPPYVEGFKVVLDGGLLNKKESDALCVPMLCTFAPYWKALSRGKTPKELGMTSDEADPSVGYFTCHVCPVNSTPPRQSHANILFRVTANSTTDDDVKTGKRKADGSIFGKAAQLKRRGSSYPPSSPIK